METEWTREKVYTLQGKAVGHGAVDDADGVIGVLDGSQHVLPASGLRVGRDARVELDGDGAGVAGASPVGLEEHGGVAALVRGVDLLHHRRPAALERRPRRGHRPEGDLLEDVPGLQRGSLAADAAAPLLRLAASRDAIDRYHRLVLHFHRANGKPLRRKTSSRSRKASIFADDSPPNFDLLQKSSVKTRSLRASIDEIAGMRMRLRTREGNLSTRTAKTFR